MRSYGHRLAKLEAEAAAVQLRQSTEGMVRIPGAIRMEPKAHLDLVISVLLAHRLPNGQQIPNELKVRMELELAKSRLRSGGKSGTSSKRNSKRKKAVK